MRVARNLLRGSLAFALAALAVAPADISARPLRLVDNSLILFPFQAERRQQQEPVPERIDLAHGSQQDQADAGGTSQETEVGGS